MISDLQLNEYDRCESERVKQMREAMAAYSGDLPSQLTATKSDPNARDNVKLNFARSIVDVGVDYLFGDEVCIEIEKEAEDDQASVSDPRDEWLDKAWDANRGQMLLKMMAIYGGIFGDVYVKMMAPAERGGYPRLVLWEPDQVRVFWDPADYQNVVAYVREWHGVDHSTQQRTPVAFRQFVEKNETGRWQVRDMQSRGDRAGWVQTGLDVWPWEFCPLFHCQNLPGPGSVYGTSDLEGDVVGINLSMNFVLSNLQRIIRMSAHPQPVGKGFDAAKLDLEPGKLIGLPSKDSSIEYLEATTNGGMSLEQYARLKEAFHQIARVPEVATGKVDGIGALSGVALQILCQPLVQKTKTKRLLYGEMLEAISRGMLEVGGMALEQDVEIELRWPNILPVDDKSEAETAVIHETLGVSKDTLLTRLGYDPEAEAKKKDEERQRSMSTVGSAMLQFGRGAVPGQSPAPTPPNQMMDDAEDMPPAGMTGA